MIDETVETYGTYTPDWLKAARKFNWVNPLSQFAASATQDNRTPDKYRYYMTPAGNRYPSVTSILGEYKTRALADWRGKLGDDVADTISKQAARRGTRFHDQMERILHNSMHIDRLLEPTLSENLKLVTEKLSENMDNIHRCESTLYNDSLRIAGRVDCIAEWNGILSVIDFKTSTSAKKEKNIRSYFEQATAYALMYEKESGLVVPQVVIIIATDAEYNSPQIFVRQKDQYIVSLMRKITNFHTKLKLEEILGSAVRNELTKPQIDKIKEMYSTCVLEWNSLQENSSDA